MPLSNMDAREVTMHYKRKGDRVDEVLHDIVLNHVNHLEHENNRLREALEFYADEDNNRHKEAFTVGQFERMSQVAQDEGYLARKALEGDKQ